MEQFEHVFVHITAFGVGTILPLADGIADIQYMRAS